MNFLNEVETACNGIRKINQVEPVYRGYSVDNERCFVMTDTTDEITADKIADKIERKLIDKGIKTNHYYKRFYETSEDSYDDLDKRYRDSIVIIFEFEYLIEEDIYSSKAIKSKRVTDFYQKTFNELNVRNVLEILNNIFGNDKDFSVYRDEGAASTSTVKVWKVNDPEAKFSSSSPVLKVKVLDNEIRMTPMNGAIEVVPTNWQSRTLQEFEEDAKDAYTMLSGNKVVSNSRQIKSSYLNNIWKEGYDAYDGFVNVGCDDINPYEPGSREWDIFMEGYYAAKSDKESKQINSAKSEEDFEQAVTDIADYFMVNADGNNIPLGRKITDSDYMEGLDDICRRYNVSLRPSKGDSLTYTVINNSRQIKSRVMTADEANFHEGDVYKNKYGMTIVIEKLDGDYVRIKQFRDEWPDRTDERMVSIPSLHDHFKWNNFTKIKNINNSRQIISSNDAKKLFEDEDIKDLIYEWSMYGESKSVKNILKEIDFDNPDAEKFIKFFKAVKKYSTEDELPIIEKALKLLGSSRQIKSSKDDYVLQTIADDVEASLTSDWTGDKLKQFISSDEDTQRAIVRSIIAEIWNFDEKDPNFDNFCPPDILEKVLRMTQDNIKAHHIKSSKQIKSSYTSWEDFYDEGCKLGLTTYMNALDDVHDKYGKFANVPKNKLSELLQKIPEDTEERHHFIDDMFDYFDFSSILSSKNIKSDVILKKGKHGYEAWKTNKLLAKVSGFDEKAKEKVLSMVPSYENVIESRFYMDKSRKFTLSEVAQYLASLFFDLRTIHFNTTGGEFYTYHKLAEDLYEQTEDYYDDIVETAISFDNDTSPMYVLPGDWIFVDENGSFDTNGQVVQTLIFERLQIIYDVLENVQEYDSMVQSKIDSMMEFYDKEIYKLKQALK